MDENPDGRPVLHRTVELFTKHPDVAAFIVTGRADDAACTEFKTRHPGRQLPAVRSVDLRYQMIPFAHRRFLLMVLRRTRLWFLLWIVAVVYMYFSLRTIGRPRLWLFHNPAFTYVLIVPMFAPFIALAITVRRLRRRLQRLDYRMCLCCEYDLHDLPDDGVCPECGKPYSRSKTIEAARKR